MNKYNQILRIVLAITVTALTCHAAWGDFDGTFGFLGAAIDNNSANHYPKAVALQADGKILVTGYKLVSGKKRFFLRRYLSNGQVDTSFGSNGSAFLYALINVNADYFGSRIVVQSNGRIAVAGVGNQLPVVWRYHSNGYPDTSFGGNGGMRTFSAYATTFTAPRIATYSDILYVGLIEIGSTSTVVIKINSYGTQDTSFGSSGEALTDAGNTFSLAVDPATGNILLGGRRRSDPNDYGIERFLTTGVLDPSFNRWNATYQGFVGSNPSDFLRLANGEFVLNERWFNITSAISLGANYVRLSSNGAFTSRTTYEPYEILNQSEWTLSPCPDINAQQSDAKVIMKGMNYDELFRFSGNFATVETMSCASYANLAAGSRTPAVLQTDDKMVAAGTYGGYIALVRTMP